MSCRPLKCEFKINVPKKENYLDGVEINPDYKAFFESNIFTNEYPDVLGSDTDNGIIYKGVLNLLNEQSCNNDTCDDIWVSCPKEQEDKTYIEEETDEEKEDTTDISRAATMHQSYNRKIRRGTTIKPLCNQLKYYAVQELQSTAYTLRVITQSVIGQGNIKFNITDDIGQLTGRWQNDNKYISMNIENQGNGPGKLIMGFGPSAAGKSYMAEQIVKIMHQADPSFPTFFLNIDGGNYRQYSAVYQRVLSAIENKFMVDDVCYIGIENLKKSINTSKIKKRVMDYLIGQRNQNPQLQINLYVPDTLTSCDLNFGCMKKIKKYLDITQSHNEWIASMIYQHETGDTCPFKKGYKCLGTTTSGENREKCESKKYEGGQNYKKGYELGNKYLRSATYLTQDKPKYMFRIHNTNDLSRENISIFEDLSEYANDEAKTTRIGQIAQAVSINKIKYINNKVKYNPICNKISTVCELDNLFDNGKYKKIYKNNQMIVNEICRNISTDIDKCLNIFESAPSYPAPVKQPLLFPSMFDESNAENNSDSYLVPGTSPPKEPDEEEADEEEADEKETFIGGRKHKKTKKQRRTKKKKNKNKKNTRKINRAIKKKSIKKKRYA